jgi:hypothetical protein
MYVHALDYIKAEVLQNSRTYALNKDAYLFFFKYIILL